MNCVNVKQGAYTEKSTCLKTRLRLIEKACPARIEKHHVNMLSSQFYFMSPCDAFVKGFLYFLLLSSLANMDVMIYICFSILQNHCTIIPPVISCTMTVSLCRVTLRGDVTNVSCKNKV